VLGKMKVEQLVVEQAVVEQMVAEAAVGGSGAVGGGESGGGTGGSGAVGGGESGGGTLGKGKMGCCDGFGDLSFGNDGACGSLLVVPIMETWSRGGSFIQFRGKSMASKASSASSRATASG